MSAPNIFTNNRFTSLKNDSNDYSSSSFKPQRNNKPFRQRNEQPISIKPVKKTPQLDMENESLFPSLTLDDSSKSIVPSQFSNMSYLDHCNKIKAEEEIRRSLLNPGWIQMNYNEKSKKKEVSYNGYDFISIEQYEIDRNRQKMLDKIGRAHV